jgi:NitT/TauT family transport system substrate-binding protein
MSAFTPAPPSRRRALALLAVPAALGFAPARVRADEPLPLRVATATSDSYGEEFYAQDGGFFERAGLRVTPSIFLNGAQCLTAVISGNADVGVTNPVSLVQAIQHGVSIACFAGGCYYSSGAPTTALFVARDAPYRTAKDLEGQTIALLSIKDFSIAAVDEWLAAGGADPAKVKTIEIPGPEMSVALQRGTVAAASIPEPYVAASTAPLRMVGKSFDAIAKRFYIDVWATSPAFAARNPGALRRFTSAIYETARWANAHHDETAAILAKYAKMEPAVIKRMTRASYATALDPGDLQPPLDAAYKYKIIDTPVRAADVIARL